MNALFIILLCLLCIVLIVLAVLSEKMCRNLAYPWFKPYEETFRRSKENEHSYGDFDNYEREHFTLTLRDGYEINGEYFPLDPKKVVIITHGHGDNKYTGIRFLQVFRALGYSTVIYDLRAHGSNVRGPVKMGLVESKDLLEVIEAVKQRFPGAEIGLHGLSMGAGTTSIALSYHPDVKFAVIDCGYSSLRKLCQEIIVKTYHGPSWLIGPVDLWNKLRYGFRLSEVEPQAALEQNEIPVCFIHGEKDGLIDWHHSQELYEHNKGAVKELHIVPDADHAQAWLHDPAAYESIVRDFLAKL